MNEIVQEIDTGALLIGLFGGLAIFLLGMEQMTNSLKAVAGSKVKGLLAKLTENPFKGLLTGTAVTAVLQSSSVTSVLLIGFVSAGLISVQQSIGITIGAGIGTTVTAQIIAFKITEYALLLVTIGFLMKFASQQEKFKQYGVMVLGIGLIFFGMVLMGNATQPLRAYQPFIDFMLHLENPLIAVIAGAIVTGIIQSSAATIALVMILASQGLLGLEIGIALTLGANIGTCVTALLASIGRTRIALQTALVHIIFNVIGVIIWFGFIDQLAELVRWMSPVITDLNGAEMAVAEAPRQIANAHTAFNVVNAMIFIWFTGPIARLVQYLAPEKPEDVTLPIKPKYLDDTILDTPELALDRVRMELGEVAITAQEMVQKALPAATVGHKNDLLELVNLDDKVDLLHTEIIAYLAQLSKKEINEKQTKQLAGYISIANNLENIGDLIETNIVHTGFGRIKNDVHMSETTLNILSDLHERVCQVLDKALQSVQESNIELAQEVTAAKIDIVALSDKAERHLTGRLKSSQEKRVIHFRLESELISYLKRVYYLSRQIALQTEEILTE